MTPIPFKPIDKKLLALLYHNSREQPTKIAKKLKITREQVKYRINKFERTGIIKGYVPLVNYGRLGHHITSLIFFKLAKPAHKDRFCSELKHNSNRINTVEVLTKYDIGALFVFKDIKDRNNKISALLSKNNDLISDYKIIDPYVMESYPLKFLGNQQAQPHIFQEYTSETYKLDEKEKSILKILNKNANARIVDIHKETGLSAELILYKLKKLKEQQVFITSRAMFDMEKTGFFYTIVFLRLKNNTENNQQKLRTFAKESKNIETFMMLLGDPNLYMQIVHKDMSELTQTLLELKQVVTNDNIEIEIILLKNEGIDHNIIPFL